MEEGCDYSRVYSSRGCCWSTGGTESGQACEKRLVKSGKNTLKNAIVEGTMDGSLEALSGGDFKWSDRKCNPWKKCDGNGTNGSGIKCKRFHIGKSKRNEKHKVSDCYNECSRK